LAKKLEDMKFEEDPDYDAIIEDLKDIEKDYDEENR
jgi:hypothetical protein